MTALFALMLFLPPRDQPGPTLTPDRPSLTSVHYREKDCRGDEEARGCRQALLTFARVRMAPAGEPIPDEVTLVFRNPSGAWEASVRYHPRQCEEVRGNYLCKNVSWRIAPGARTTRITPSHSDVPHNSLTK